MPATSHTAAPRSRTLENSEIPPHPEDAEPQARERRGPERNQPGSPRRKTSFAFNVPTAWPRGSPSSRHIALRGALSSGLTVKHTGWGFRLQPPAWLPTAPGGGAAAGWPRMVPRNREAATLDGSAPGHVPGPPRGTRRRNQTQTALRRVDKQAQEEQTPRGAQGVVGSREGAAWAARGALREQGSLR